MGRDRSGPNIGAGLIVGALAAIVLGLLWALAAASIDIGNLFDPPTATSTVEPR